MKLKEFLLSALLVYLAIEVFYVASLSIIAGVAQNSIKGSLSKISKMILSANINKVKYEDKVVIKSLKSDALNQIFIHHRITS